jgi:hypothetical protein
MDNFCIICSSDSNLTQYNGMNMCGVCFSQQEANFLNFNSKRSKFYPEIDKITEKIYLGNEDAGRESELLKSYGITNVLMCGRHLQNFHPGTFEYLNLEIDDYIEADIKSHFERAREFIEKSTGNVFVHCHAGISRSPSILISYIMWKENLTFDEALKLVKSKRNVNPNEGFIKQLKEYEKELFK